MTSTQEPIPQCSPLSAYLAQAPEIEAAIASVLSGGRYILGPAVAAFEQSFARWLGANHCIGVGNGTDAIEIALRTLDIGPGDAVVTTSMSAVATAFAIRKTGAIPLFAEVDPVHGLIDPSSIDRLCETTNQRIRAIVPVHLYGRCADMDAIMEIGDRRGLHIVEDCAQAHGALWRGRHAGTFGKLATFSFYPTKNLGAIGDGGAVVTDDADLRERAILLREYGWKTRYVSATDGGNSRLDELQAAILSVKLTRLSEDTSARRGLAEIYRMGIKNPRVVLHRGCDDGHVYHQFVVLVEDRDDLQAHLASNGIGSLVHYPAAIHQQPAFSDRRFSPVPLPNTERWSATTLSLPMFPQMRPDQAMRVVEAINSWR